VHPLVSRSEQSRRHLAHDRVHSAGITTPDPSAPYDGGGGGGGGGGSGGDDVTARLTACFY